MTELSEAAKALRREYKRKWARANREKTKEAENRYWEKKAAELLAAKETQQDETQQHEA